MVSVSSSDDAAGLRQGTVFTDHISFVSQAGDHSNIRKIRL